MIGMITPARAQFAQKYGAQTRGDVVLTGNILVRPDNLNAVDNNSQPASKVDIDGDGTGAGATDNSSSAALRIPSGSTILSAQLYWQSRIRTVNTGPKTVRISTNGTFGGYQTVTTSNVTSLNAGGNGNVYSARADVTNIIRNITVFPATILVGGAQVETFPIIDNTPNDPNNPNNTTGSYAGWSLVVAYANPVEPIRQLRIFDGFSSVGNNAVDSSVSGFLTPDAGNFTVKLGIVAFEGDRGITGDQLQISKGGATAFTQLSDGLNPATNFFNSTIGQDGVSFTPSQLNPPLRNPGTDPANANDSIGLDVDRIALSGPGPFFDNAQSSLNLRFISTGDVYQVVAFSTAIPTAEIVGRVFDDKNFGGGAGRAFNAGAGMAGVAGTRVELYSSAGAFLSATTTDGNGIYAFSNLGSTAATTDYLVRVVNNTVISSRGPAADSAGLTPVQTFRTEAKSTINPATGSATAQPVTNRVGGETPAATDGAPVNTVGATIPANAQSVTRVQLGTDPVRNVDFGFNFDTIVNTNNAGQGSLRQFILNSNALSNAGLAQNNQTAGQEVSIFQIPATDPRYNANGPARILLASPLDAIAGANAAATVVDGATQTVNVANTNAGTLGLASNVGATGGRAVAPVAAPEIEISGNGTLTNLISIGAASNVTLRNLAFTGNAGANAGNGNQGAVLINGATNPLVTSNVFGATTTLAGVPSAAVRVNDAIVFGSATSSNVTLTNNLFSQLGRRAILAGAFQSNQTISGLTIEGNQILTTGSQMGGNQSDGEGIILFGAYQNAFVRGNLFDGVATGSGNASFGDNGIEVFFNVAGSAAGGLTIEDNTIRNGRGVGISMADTSADGGATTAGTNTNGKTILVSRNLIQNVASAGTSGGSGIEVRGAQNVKISQNSFFGNGALALDLGTAFGAGPGKGVSPNDGAKSFTADSGNGGMDYPIFTRVQQIGANLRVSGYIGNDPAGNAIWSGAQIELYFADDTPANQNGEVILGDGRSVAHGEGRFYRQTIVADTKGLFDATLSGVTLGANTLTATATDANGNTSEFGANSALVTPAATDTVDGRVYLDGNRNGTLDNQESGTGVGGLFIKAVLQGQNSAARAVPVDPATGNFSFDTLAPGNYTLVLDDNATLTDIAPAIPAGYVGTQSPNGTRQVTVGNRTILSQDFGLFRGAQISGTVFEDQGAATGPGLAGVKVSLTRADNGALIDSATTDANGNFSFRVPDTLASTPLRVVETNLSGYLSVSGNAGQVNGAPNASGTYTLATDTIQFNYAAGSTYSGLRFGDARGVLFENEDSKTGPVGSAVVYPHVFTAQSNGSVTFNTTQRPSPNNPDWSVVTYLDSNNNGVLDGADAVISGPIAVVAGTPITVFLKNFIPTTAANGAQDRLTISATFTPTGSPQSGPVQTLSRSDLTTVAASTGLLLTKTVNKATAISGDTLVYTITYRNTGAEALTNLVVRDATPAYTTFVSAANGTLAPGLTAPTIVAPAAAGQGAVTWSFGGSLNPGQSGTVSFSVRVQ